MKIPGWLASGLGAVVLSAVLWGGSALAQHSERLAALDVEVRANISDHEDLKDRLARIEDKLDRLLEGR